MSLEEVFPEDPRIPSLAYAACSLIPFTLPWSTNPIKLGTGFHSKLAQSTNPFAAECAFDDGSLKTTRLRYRSEASGTFTHNESSFGSHSQDHMTFSLAASAGVAIVEASGQAKFESHAINNSDEIRSSLAGKMFAGYVDYEEVPRFSPAACGAARASQGPVANDKFEQKYGDYYVSALRIGAANGTELSAGSSSNYTSEATSWSVTVVVKVFCWKASTTKSESSYTSSAAATGTIKFNGFDTLSLSQWSQSGSDSMSHKSIISIANTNLEKGQLLQGRLGEATSKFELLDGCFVSDEQVKSLLQAGLVIEIQLLPYAKLRDYISSRGR